MEQVYLSFQVFMGVSIQAVVFWVELTSGSLPSPSSGSECHLTTLPSTLKAASKTSVANVLQKVTERHANLNAHAVVQPLAGGGETQ
jgi:hypothetical protein